MKWVKLKRYLEVSGDTPDAIQKKIARGLWVEGAQFRDGPDGVRYFNPEAIDRWVESVGGQAPTTRPKVSQSESSAPAHA